MVARENSLRSDDRDHLSSLQALMKKRDDLDKAIAAQVIINIKISVPGAGETAQREERWLFFQRT